LSKQCSQNSQEEQQLADRSLQRLATGRIQGFTLQPVLVHNAVVFDRIVFASMRITTYVTSRWSTSEWQAINGKTKALRTLPLRWVSAQIL